MDDGYFVGKLILLCLLLVVSAFFSSSESAFFSLGRFRVRRLHKYGSSRYKAAKDLLDKPTHLLSTLLIGNEFCNGAIGVVGTTIVYDLMKGYIDSPIQLSLVSVAMVLPLFLFFSEILPKSLGLKYSERVVALHARPLYLFYRLVKPLRHIIAWIPELLMSFWVKSGQPRVDISEDMFRSMVDVGAQEGVLDTQEQQLIHNIFRLDDIKVKTIMTPKSSVSSIPQTTTVEQALQQCDEERYSRYPVLDGHDHVTGVLYAKDLLGQGPIDQAKSISTFLRSPLLVGPNAYASELFARFRNNRTHFAVVVAEDTQVILGVVTLEDILEEIFGDLRDERDVEGGA